MQCHNVLFFCVCFCLFKWITMTDNHRCNVTISRKVSFLRGVEKTRTIASWAPGCFIPWNCVEETENYTDFETSYKTVNFTSQQCCPGWTFLEGSCSAACDTGFYGLNCKSSCNCTNASSCDHVTGECPQQVHETCPDGFTGYNCSKVCSMGRFGQNCSQICACSHNSSCDPVTGSCHLNNESIPTRCSAWTFGPSCQTCECDRNQTRFCNTSDGICVCKTGYTGQICDMTIVATPSTSDKIAYVALVSVVVVLFIVAIVIFLIRRRCLRKSTQPMSVMNPTYNVAVGEIHFSSVNSEVIPESDSITTLKSAMSEQETQKSDLRSPEPTDRYIPRRLPSLPRRQVNPPSIEEPLYDLTEDDEDPYGYCDLERFQSSTSWDENQNLNHPGTDDVYDEVKEDVPPTFAETPSTIMYPEGGYFNPELHMEEDYVKVV